MYDAQGRLINNTHEHDVLKGMIEQENENRSDTPQVLTEDQIKERDEVLSKYGIVAVDQPEGVSLALDIQVGDVITFPGSGGKHVITEIDLAGGVLHISPAYDDEADEPKSEETPVSETPAEEPKTEEPKPEEPAVEEPILGIDEAVPGSDHTVVATFNGNGEVESLVTDPDDLPVPDVIAGTEPVTETEVPTLDEVPVLDTDPTATGKKGKKAAATVEFPVISENPDGSPNVAS